ncbi:MAG TPA: hypothetical protein VL945_00925 [Candidatus Saccharimonadales bacterium]|nr:hypothetical protein [Candidatus Saccharimonadales bacterium]
MATKISPPPENGRRALAVIEISGLVRPSPSGTSSAERKSLIEALRQLNGIPFAAVAKPDHGFTPSFSRDCESISSAARQVGIADFLIVTVRQPIDAAVSRFRLAPETTKLIAVGGWGLLAAAESYYNRIMAKAGASQLNQLTKILFSQSAASGTDGVVHDFTADSLYHALGIVAREAERYLPKPLSL